MSRSQKTPWPPDVILTWREARDAARLTMDRAPKDGGVLIEVAAQHPLLADGRPGPEFAARLTMGRALYIEMKHRSDRVKMYVPGSIHTWGGRPEAVSLSESGVCYLIDSGIPASDLHGEDLNALYMGNHGVYGSSDECYVSAAHFISGAFGEFHAVVSPGQLPRKMMHYIAAGVYPMLHTSPVHDAFHDVLDELIDAVPTVLKAGPAAIGPSSTESIRHRSQRRPDSPDGRS